MFYHQKRRLSQFKVYNFCLEKVDKAVVIDKLSLYNVDCEFSWAYCKYFWESHPHLPHIDVDELVEFVNKNK